MGSACEDIPGWVLQVNPAKNNRTELIDSGMTGADHQLWTWSRQGNLLINKYDKMALSPGCSTWEFAEKKRWNRWKRRQIREGKTMDEITIMRCTTGGALDQG